MRNKTLELLAGAAIAAFAGTAIAQISSPPPSTPPSGGSSSGSASGSGGTSGSTGSASTSTSAGGDFTKLDADKDGMVSKKEAGKNKDLTAKWETLDTNKDGKLDQAEFAAFEGSSSTKY